MKTQKFGREYHRKYYQKRKQAIYDLLGGKCVGCGSCDDLQIDHIEPSQKSYNISRKLSIKNNLDELKKCQLLCKDCHREKTAKENSGFRHGTIYGWMKKKCKCIDCESSKNEFNRNRNEKRRRER